jgi:signal transduction histidine kinase
VQLVAAEAEAAGLQVEAAGDGATVRADRGQLRRAVLNLARNAIQAATAAPAAVRGDGPHVRVAARAAGDQVVLAVWNRGQAIDPAARARLFEPFFTTREKGTGLGLAFVRDIAHDHGGRVEVDSGAGETEFRIIVPAAGPGGA